MIRPVSKTRKIQFVNDFQIFKGTTSQTMEVFGAPVAVAHEARLMIRDDQKKSASKAIYAIHQRSENRILQIIESAKTAAVTVLTPRTTANRVPLPKAA